MRAIRMVLVGVMIGGIGASAAPRKRILAEPPNPVKVETATFLGTEGSEWLSTGVFLPDGRILICGVTVEADITLLGVKASVLGKDAPPLPKITRYKLVGEKDTGRVQLPDAKEAAEKHADLELDLNLGDEFSLDEPLTARQKKQKAKKEEAAKKAKLKSWPKRLEWAQAGATVESKTMFRKLCWLQEEATGFMAVFSPDLRKIHRFVRFPRGAGSITAAVLGKDGHVYIAGSATERISGIPGRHEMVTVGEDDGGKSSTAGCHHTYLAKLAPDLSRVIWVCENKGWSIAPQLTLMQNGNIGMNGPGLLWYSPEGKVIHTLTVGKVDILSGVVINPLNGENPRIGDWMSPTGREPYRTPRLYIRDRDGKTVMELYAWRGPFSGIDAMDAWHLVADSATRTAVYDAHGNLYISTWSHGGNNVMTRFPYDIERRTPNGLGVNVTSGMASTFCLLKLSPEFDVVAATVVGSSGIGQKSVCVDDCVVTWGGGNYSRLTANTLSDVGGRRLGILSPRFRYYRFLSDLPAVGGRVAVGGCYDRPASWGFVSGKIGDRPMLLCLSGAIPYDTMGDNQVRVDCPTRNPVQDGYAGGLMDGYAILFDLTSKVPWPEELEKPRPPRTRREYKGPAPLWPEENKKFAFGTESYITVKATFRDEHDAMWPSFWQGQAMIGGAMIYSTTRGEAQFMLKCPSILQEQGRQDKRVCGELVKYTTVKRKDKKGREKEVGILDNPVNLLVKSSSPWEPLKESSTAYSTCRLQGELHVGDRRVPFKDAECKARFNFRMRGVKADENTRPNMAYMTIRFTVPGKSIGLTGKLAEQNIRVQFCCTAQSEVDAPAGGGSTGGSKLEFPTFE